MTTKARKPKKPKLLKLNGWDDCYIAGMKVGNEPWERWACCIGRSIYHAEDCRKIANWLHRAADYLEYLESKGE